MTIPDFQSLMRPVLAALADGEVRRSRHVKDAMVEQFELSAEERAQMLPSGRQRTMDNRVGWATTYLSQAGLIERPQRGQLRISPAGREALRRFPERIDMKVLETYPEYLAFRDRTRISTSDEPSAITPTTSVPETPELDRATPSELIERARRTNRAAVEGEVLKKALTLSPTGFEDLVIRLLEAMGYGRAGSVERTSANRRRRRRRHHQPGSPRPRPHLRSGEAVRRGPPHRPTPHPRVRRRTPRQARRSWRLHHDLAIRPGRPRRSRSHQCAHRTHRRRQARAAARRLRRRRPDRGDRRPVRPGRGLLREPVSRRLLPSRRRAAAGVRPEVGGPTVTTPRRVGTCASPWPLTLRRHGARR